MKLSGEQSIPASRQRVWEGLNDPDILKQCIKGCEVYKQDSDTKLFRAGDGESRPGQGRLQRRSDRLAI